MSLLCALEKQKHSCNSLYGADPELNHQYLQGMPVIKVVIADTVFTVCHTDFTRMNSCNLTTQEVVARMTHILQVRERKRRRLSDSPGSHIG